MYIPRTEELKENYHYPVKELSELLQVTKRTIWNIFPAEYRKKVRNSTYIHSDYVKQWLDDPSSLK